MSEATKTTATVPAAETVREKGKQLATTVPLSYHEAIDAYHWEKRVKVSDIVREALDDYVAKHGIIVSAK